MINHFLWLMWLLSHLRLSAGTVAACALPLVILLEIDSILLRFHLLLPLVSASRKAFSRFHPCLIMIRCPLPMPSLMLPRLLWLQWPPWLRRYTVCRRPPLTPQGRMHPACEPSCAHGRGCADGAAGAGAAAGVPRPCTLCHWLLTQRKPRSTPSMPPRGRPRRLGATATA